MLTSSTTHVRVATIGIYIYALSTVAGGLFDLIWGEFEAAHQPIGALGDHIPGQTLLAYVTAIAMIAGGLALLWRRTARAGSLVTAFIYFAFALFWLPRFYTGPHLLGFHVSIVIGVLAGMFTQLIVVAGGLILFYFFFGFGSRVPRSLPIFVRWTFGAGAVLFGLAHLTATQRVALMVPPWMPLGGAFWVRISGVAFLCAGMAILCKVLDVTAAHLLALMLLLFEGPVLLPNLASSYPRNHVAWGANAYNLAAVGAVTIFAAFLSATRKKQPAVLQAAVVPIEHP